MYDNDRHPGDADRYAEYEAAFADEHQDRRERRKRKPKAAHQPKKAAAAVVRDIAQTDGLEGGFETTYKLSLYEETFLRESLRPFYERALICDVEAIVKGGKEANVYRCTAHPAFAARTGQTQLAAKVYRPRMFRSLRNDAAYREGRALLTEEGRAVKERDQRLKRAVRDKTDMGAQLMHTSWLMYEHTTLQTLFAAGASVPEPVSSAPNALLMAYIGEPTLAAPPLAAVALERDEAAAHFDAYLHMQHTLCAHGLIHGDLSPYNVLFWRDRLVFIDFPQVVEGRSNPHAETILARDVARMCAYFAAHDVRAAANPEALAALFWGRYFARERRYAEADYSRITAQDDE